MNQMRSLSQDKAKKRAQKSVRKTIMQKIVGKGKNLKAMSPGQKASLEKKTDKRMKTMGSRVLAMVKKSAKQMVKKHREKKQAMMQKGK